MTTVVISQPMYFPWPGFFEQMKLADVYIWLDDAQFSKGSFTNRVQVLTPQKKVWMSIPLRDKTWKKINELEARDEKWRTAHRDLLSQSFRRAHYRTTALDIFDTSIKASNLCEVLISSAERIAQELHVLPSTILRSSQMKVSGNGSSRVLELVKSAAGNRYLTGHGAADYLDHEGFESSGVQVEYMHYNVAPWTQFEESFTPYVTALDLIARQGQDAPSHLCPHTQGWREFIAGRGNSNG